MINDLDEVLRQLLIREIPIKNGEVDIAFDQPKREWSARLNRPTLNLFLHDIRENAKLRNLQWERQDNGKNRSVTVQQTPIRLDLHYLITAWAAEPDDEHRLLTRTLMSLFRYTYLPKELLSESLQDQPFPIPLKVAQYDELRNPADLWSALDNELRPGIICITTLALNPYLPITTPLVRTRDLRIGQAAVPLSQQRLQEQVELDRFWTIGGTISSQEPLEKLRLTLVERGLEVDLQPEGRFAIGNLEAGDYTLEVSVEGRKPRRHKITVPSPDYELTV